MGSESDQGVASVIIVGAGAAGLATAACLKQRGVAAIVLEAGNGPATTWRSLYDRLHLHTVRQLSGLPGYPMPRSFPRYPAREQVAAYLRDYAAKFQLDVRPNNPAQRAHREGDVWVVETPNGPLRARALVSATGIFARPDEVNYPGQEAYTGAIIHGSAYKNSMPYAGQRVLVIGSGNTGAEIAIDLAEHSVEVAVSIRGGANVVPRELAGIPIQRWAHVIAALPGFVTRPLAAMMLRNAARRQARAGVPKPMQGIIGQAGVPIIGLEFLELARKGAIAIRPGLREFKPDVVVFRDGQEAWYDTVIFATGYRPALGYLDVPLTFNEAGHPALDGVRSTDAPDLYFVGMRYDIKGTLFNIAHEAPVAARQISERLIAAPVSA